MINTGIFPNKLKIAKGIPIYRINIIICMHYKHISSS